MCLELAKRITAEKGRDIDEAASSLMLEAMFVDDFLGGGSLEDVQRMRGSAVIDSNGEASYTGTMSKILSTTGFKTKAQVVTGSCSDEEAKALREKALGLPYCPRSDVFMMRLQPSITINRKRGTKVVTILQQSDINRIRSGEAELTKRAVLSFLMGNFDPLGLLTPLIVRGKILLRRLYGPDYVLGWDDPLPEEEQDLWDPNIQSSFSTAWKDPRDFLLWPA